MKIKTLMRAPFNNLDSRFAFVSNSLNDEGSQDKNSKQNNTNSSLGSNFSITSQTASPWGAWSSKHISITRQLHERVHHHAWTCAQPEYDHRSCKLGLVMQCWVHIIAFCGQGLYCSIIERHAEMAGYCVLALIFSTTEPVTKSFRMWNLYFKALIVSREYVQDCDVNSIYLLNLLLPLDFILFFCWIGVHSFICSALNAWSINRTEQ